MNDIIENNEDQDKKASVVECPHCYTKILPLADNTCPACRAIFRV